MSDWPEVPLLKLPPAQMSVGETGRMLVRKLSPPRSSHRASHQVPASAVGRLITALAGENAPCGDGGLVTVDPDAIIVIAHHREPAARVRALPGVLRPWCG
jgi:hypothetical protein